MSFPVAPLRTTVTAYAEELRSQSFEKGCLKENLPSNSGMNWNKRIADQVEPDSSRWTAQGKDR
eukprot:5621794-Amphidinium_carterae.1